MFARPGRRARRTICARLCKVRNIETDGAASVSILIQPACGCGLEGVSHAAVEVGDDEDLLAGGVDTLVGDELGG
ncbi:MAG: hypothetical protein IPG51_17530 [Chloroflexi bacterium]|nr:hypothetical protein [Chloroflexota bacterium]